MEWFANWFDSPYYHMLYQHRDDAEAQAFIEALLQKTALPQGARVLDLACGKGRHSFYLASKGIDATGVDLSGSSIADALSRTNGNPEFYVHDMRKPFRINYFDGIFNLFTSFGYFSTVREHLTMLKSVAVGLKSDGIFVLDYFNAVKVEAGIVPYATKTVNDIVFEWRKTIENNCVIKRIHVEDGKKTFEFSEKVHLFKLADFEELMSASGLSIDGIFGNYQLEAFDPNTSDRLILICRLGQ